ncbi:hypothetical protein K491DRAFT_698892 [Lophiostoma macrostomum CBS 122681]|uniref:Glycosyl transferase CAP10 domain-containing protein n=1 Tax=Lophiostoma macrostomum CBS 122681 TaxID=1314788 RepID=A0A6A6SQ10_9PLEO|nr:hypothetical protein K491DRAFT_698892 [Lophiostoma macrostomum CBS 122681]
MLLRRRLRCGITDALTYFLVASCILIFSVICMILYGTRTQHPNLPSIVKGILPAGRCQCEYSTEFKCDTCLDCAAAQGQKTVGNETNGEAWHFMYPRDANEYGLSEEQCLAAFPGQYEDLERAKKWWLKKGRVQKSDLEGFELTKGMVRAMVYDGELYILQTFLVDSVNREKAIAALSSLHRALVTSPKRSTLPNIEFVFTVEDLPAQPDRPLWCLARRAQDEALWLMPDFGFWSWDMPQLGTLNEVAAEAIQREKTSPWNGKKEKLVWRGNIAFAPKLRRVLVDAAKGKPWSDVGQVSWDDPNFKEQYVGPIDQCHYKFIAHAEGRSYSGALKYRQLCRSVIVAHKLQWIQHYHYLLRSSGPHQNFVEVERDFSDLSPAMDDLLAHPKKAKHIADNSVAVFRERYLTQAAEACYWRALVQSWAEVTKGWDVWLFEGEGAPIKRAVRYETFILYEWPRQMEYPTSAQKS